MTLDQELLQFLNRDAAHPALDLLLVAVSVLGYAIPYALVGLGPWRLGRRWDAVAFWIAIAIADVAVFLLKNAIERPRPIDIREVMTIGGGFAMPSGHATRAFAGATALWALGPGWRRLLFGFAGLTLLSRVYVGAHYPSDVLVGAVLGVFLGLIAIQGIRVARGETERIADARIQAVKRAWNEVRRALRVGPLASRSGAAIVFFGPLLAVLLGMALYAVLWPELVPRTVAFLTSYFLPFGIEFGIPIGIGLGLPWYGVAFTIIYIDLWLSLFLIYNLDHLRRIRRVDGWFERAQTRGLEFVRRRPWMLKFEFVGIAIFVFIPLTGTGIITGALIGRFIGMSHVAVWLSVMLGSAVRIVLYALIAAGVLHLVV